MNMLDIINQAGGIGAIAQQLGVSPAVAQQGAEALLPAILGGFKQTANTHADGIGGLIGMLGQLGGGGLLDNVLGSQPTDIDAGNSVLGQIFGSKDVSRAVATDASAKTGIDPSILKSMLPILAMLAAGYMAQHGDKPTAEASGEGGIGGMLGSVLSGMMGGGASTKAAPADGILGSLGALIDMDKDGNPLDDIVGMAGKLGTR